jgi:hypothetical protein
MIYVVTLERVCVCVCVCVCVRARAELSPLVLTLISLAECKLGRESEDLLVRVVQPDTQCSYD